ncbi:MAG TPA: GatB/YqeY domain-containing protein [Thermohalobaculum sp.]|nr:GatB/YqeY domain-containing protein [Thermohalobaculum sp.]
MRDRIEEALREAMPTRDTVRVCTLRLMLAAIKDRDLALRAEEDRGDVELDDAGVHQLLSTMVKQREQSAEAYREAGRMELAQREDAETRIIREFMPKQMTEAEIRRAVAQAIGETGAGSIRDMGKVMGHLKSRYPGRMDFGDAGARVKRALG